MRVRTLLLAAVVVVAVLLAVSSFMAIHTLENFNSLISSDLMESQKLIVQNFVTARTMSRHAKLILYYDEVLTQSARNYALTGDKKWRVRYDYYDVELDNLLKQKSENRIADYSWLLSKMDISNQLLVGMERESIRLADNGELKKAIAVLDGDEYSFEKNNYANLLNQYVNKTEFVFDSVKDNSEREILMQVSNLKLINSKSKNLVLEFAAASLLVFISLVVFLIKTVLVPIEDISKVLDKLSQSKLGVNINHSLKLQKNEVGVLARAFDRLLISMKLAVRKHNLVCGVKKR